MQYYNGRHGDIFHVDILIYSQSALVLPMSLIGSSTRRLLYESVQPNLVRSNLHYLSHEVYFPLLQTTFNVG